MIQVMRDETREPALRLDAAKSAAPYIHSRLASQELTIVNPDDTKSREDLLAELGDLLKKHPDMMSTLLSR